MSTSDNIWWTKTLPLLLMSQQTLMLQVLDIKQPKSGESDVEIWSSDTKEGHMAHLGLPEPQAASCSPWSNLDRPFVKGLPPEARASPKHYGQQGARLSLDWADLRCPWVQLWLSQTVIALGKETLSGKISLGMVMAWLYHAWKSQWNYYMYHRLVINEHIVYHKFCWNKPVFTYSC